MSADGHAPHILHPEPDRNVEVVRPDRSVAVVRSEGNTTVIDDLRMGRTAVDDGLPTVGGRTTSEATIGADQPRLHQLDGSKFDDKWKAWQS
ncbi:hypothetical protein HJFPF1_02370 [Paramyrothecium foliicola]|nr:hypothetical protein HJFPF1_02370 [Paramyrothecium foliicola]